MENKMIKGAKIATIGLIITKALGVIYVIPMNAMLSEAALGMYGASYAIYAFFTQITLIGFPVGVSKIVSKYHSEDNNTMVNRTFKYSMSFICIFGFFIFLILFFGSNIFAKRVTTASYTYSEVAMTLKLLAPTLLIIPALAVTRGYTQGFQNMLPSSISIVVEQLVRVIILTAGVFLVTKVLNTNELYAIYIATAASFFSAFVGYGVIIPSFKKYYANTKNESKSTDNVLNFRKTVEVVAMYSVPFIVLTTYKSLYEMIDASTIKNVLSNLQLPTNYIDLTYATYTIRVQKLVILILTISTGFTMSIIPSFTALNAKGEYRELKKKITQVILLTLFVTSFISIFTAIFNFESFFVFYGYDNLGSEVFATSIISTVFYALYNVVGVTLLTLNRLKTVIISFVIGMVAKLVFISIFSKAILLTSIEPAQIFALSTFMGYILSLAFLLRYCIKHDLLNVKKFGAIAIRILVTIIITSILIYILKLILPSIDSTSTIRSSYIINFITLLFSGIISLAFYVILAEKLGYLKIISEFELNNLTARFRK